MTPEHILRDKLRKIEALFAGAATPGEKAAAGAAAERIRERLGRTAGKEEPVELKFSISDIRGFWSEVQRVYENRIWTSLPSSLRIARNGVLKPRHSLGVRLAVMTMSWISSSDI